MSTGTNRERLEQNNTLLEDIKTQIQNLPEAGSSGGIKQFSTIEEMNNSIGNKEGDLAVVYRSEVQNAAVDSQFQTATFPQTVVLDTAITNRVEVRYRAVDSSVMFDCMGSLNNTRFMMNCRTESGRIRIEYRSSDGITYTRTDTTGNPVDFDTEIYYERAKYWNDAIGKFIQVGGNKFEGLYEYAEKTQSNIYTLKNPKGDIKHFDLTIATENAKKDLDVSVLPYTRIEESELSISKWNVYKPTKYVFYKVDNVRSMNIVTDGTSYYLSPELGTNVVATFEKYVYENDTLISSETITINTASATKLVDLTSNTYSNYNLESGTNIENGYIYYQYTDNMHTVDVTLPTTSSVDSVQTSLHYSINVFPLYIAAPTQLSATPDYVYKKEFYGKSGVETGTLQNKENLTKDEVKHRVDIWSNYNSGIICPSDASGMFQNCTNLTTIPLLDTSSVTTMYAMFYGCTNLATIPQLDTSNVTAMYTMFQNCTNLTTIPQLDTGKVTSMSNMFAFCTNLATVPQLDTSSVTAMDSMFYGCTNLTTIPLLDTSSVTTMYAMFQNCTNLTTIPLLDTINVTTMYAMFYGCTNLTTIPQLDTSKVTSMSNMFQNCTNLSDESLNNILAMCKNATSYTETKTLKQIGLTSEQVNKCKTLNNYSAFTAAGWTTGY